MEQADTIVQIPHFYGSLKGMQKKFDNYARQDAFTGSTRALPPKYSRTEHLGMLSCRFPFLH